jgi:hypothetical protein
MGANVAEYLLWPFSGMLTPIYQTAKCHIPYQNNADNTPGQGIFKSHILYIVAMFQLLFVSCKRLLNPVLSINEFNASHSHPFHKMLLIIFMYNYHTVLYAMSIHTPKSSLISQITYLSVHKKKVPTILFPNICFSTYIGPNVTAKNVKKSQTSYPRITSVDHDNPTGHNFSPTSLHV